MNFKFINLNILNFQTELENTYVVPVADVTPICEDYLNIRNMNAVKTLNLSVLTVHTEQNN